MGTLIQTIGASWLMAVIAGSADMVTLVQAAAAAPVVLFSVVAGAVADGFERRSVMLVAQIFMLAVSVLLTAVALAGLMMPSLLLALTFLLVSDSRCTHPRGRPRSPTSCRARSFRLPWRSTALASTSRAASAPRSVA